MSINPDAHSTSEIDLTHWGVEMARKGGVPKSRVLNCLSLDDLTKYLAARHEGRSRRISQEHQSQSPPGGLTGLAPAHRAYDPLLWRGVHERPKTAASSD